MVRVLGYNREWSYYAALHGNFIGWLFVGCLVIISRSFNNFHKTLYLLSCFVFLLSFLLIAFGIDGIPYIKRVGAFSIIALTPILVGFYFYSFRKVKNLPFYLSGVSFFSIIFTMLLAFYNEIGSLPLHSFLSVPSMVSLHGLINGLIAIPSLYLSIHVNEGLHGKV